MKCIKCSAETVVLETRERREHVIERRHRCKGRVAHTFWTTQLPRPICVKTKSFIDYAFKQFDRGVEMRREQARVRDEVAKLLHAGWKYEAIIHEMKVNRSTIAAVSKELKKGTS